MIRAIYFDFYSVWAPDKLSYYLAYAELMGPDVHKQLYDAVQKYYQGDLSIDDLAGTFRYKLGSIDIDKNVFTIKPNSISPDLTTFLQSLHGHFVKVGVLANLGPQEYEVLKQFNDKNAIIETIASPYSLSIKQPLLTKEVFNKAFEAIGETADTCLFVSGNPYNLAFASALGAQTLLFEGLPSLEATLNSMLSQDMPNQ